MIKRTAPPTLLAFLVMAILLPFAIVLGAFTVIHLLADAADQFDYLVRGGSGIPGAEYLALRVPFIITQLLPVSLLGGVMFGFGMLNLTNEVVALQALGVSRWQLALPVVFIAIGATLADFGLSATIAPAANREAHRILIQEIRHGKNFADPAGETWVRISGGFMEAEGYDALRSELHNVTVFKTEGLSDLQAVLQIHSAIWDGRGWRLTGVRSLSVADSGKVEPENQNHDDALRDASPSDFASTLPSNPDDFSLHELNDYISGLERLGLTTRAYLVKRDLKFALPLSCLIMAALGLVLSLDPLPRQGGFGRNIGYALAAGFGYWLVLGFTASFGKSGVLPPWSAAWIPNLLFGCIAVSLFLFGEEK